MNTNGIGQTDRTTTAYAAKKTEKSTASTGSREIGAPKLSDKAQKYYDQLRRKYSNMDFILVSADKKEEAEANIGDYKSAKEMLVLIDTEKIEKMAADEKYRKKYEGIISGAVTQIAQIKTSLGSTAGSVKTYGMKINDGGIASFFAVVDKSMSAQRKLIAKRAAKKAEDARKAAKEEKSQNAEGAKTEKDAGTDKKGEVSRESDTVTLTAATLEELLKKIKDTVYGETVENIQTEEEKKLGQNVNYTA